MNAQEKFENYFNSIDGRNLKENIRKGTFTLNESMESMAEISENIREYDLQKFLRPLYGKNGINTNGIAEHPDFKDIAKTGESIYQYIAPVFIDIRGSTRLSLNYDLETIKHFKDQVISTCIEVIRSFDGSVHRIMGDAVLGFFGSKSIEKHQAIIDLINCVIILRWFLEKIIQPLILIKFPDFEPRDFAFRIGCNFGDDEEVYWSNYGFMNVGEVSPTGLPIDLAAKLQSLADKNEIMLGQGLIDYVKWPKEYSKYKTNAEGENIYYVEPNYSYRDPKKGQLNYKMRLLDFKKTFRIIPFDTKSKSKIVPELIPNNDIRYYCEVKKGDNWQSYISGSEYLDKGLELKFYIRVDNHSNIEFPLNILFTKKNNGEDVPFEQRNEHIQARILNKTINNGFGGAKNFTRFSTTILPEKTAFTGLHTMLATVTDKNKKIIFRDEIGVLIK